jgi:hypothetical protein
MVDVDDVGGGFLFGGVALGLVLLIWYLVFSVPEIDKCHEKGGKIVRIEGNDKCIAADALKELK